MAKTIEEKLIQLIVANPRIMRDMPRLVAEAGLELVDAEGSLYANIGSGGFWLAAAESYVPLLAQDDHPHNRGDPTRQGRYMALHIGRRRS